MTVASMPMWSAETRSISRACSATPRKKLPPPTTRAISTPSLWTSLISAAIAWMRLVSTPNPLSPARASPESLSKMRLKARGMLVFSIREAAHQRIGNHKASRSICKQKGGDSRHRLHRKLGFLLGLLLLRWLADGHSLAYIANLEAGKAADGDVLAQLANL